METALAAAEAVRLELFSAGFSPIPAEGKIPHIKDWQKLTSPTAEAIAGWTQLHPSHVNTSLLTERTPFIDIDILDPEAAEACEQLVRDRFTDTGVLLVRIGSPPKRAVPFQTSKAFPKIALNLIAPNGDTKQKIEFLCAGQQVVVDGTHPDTKKPYTWFGGSPGKVRREELPCINEAEARLLVRDMVDLLCTEHGYKQATARPKAAPAPSAVADSEYQPLTVDATEDWQWLVGNILNGNALHDSDCVLSAKLIASGMKEGATVNLVRGLLAKSNAPHDNRYYDRLHDVPRLVSSAAQKFADNAEYSEQLVSVPPKVQLLSSSAFSKSYVAPDYLVEGLLIRKYFYSLTGKTGAGKTAIALLFCALVATGRVLDGRQFEQGRVLYLAGENPVDVQQRWIAMSQQMEFDIDTIDVHFIPGVFPISQMRSAIAEEVEKLGGVALVVIDTSAAYFEGDEENNNTQAGDYARMQRSLIKTLPGGPTILALCHPVKNASDDYLQPRGGGAYINETDGNLTACNDDGVVELHTQGKFRGPNFAPMSFHLRSVTHERLKDSKGRLIPTVVAEHMTETAEKEYRKVTLNNGDVVLGILAEHKGLSYADIASRAGWLSKKDGKPNKSMAFTHVKNLKDAKLVHKGRAGWKLTDKGKTAVQGCTTLG